MSQYGVTDTGFNAKPLSVTLDVLYANHRAIFGATTDLDPSTPDAQLIDSFAGEVDQLWQLGKQIYDSFRIQGAKGAALSDLVLLSRILRQAGTPSRGSLAWTGPAGSSISLTEDFRVESSAGDLFKVSNVGVYPFGSLILVESVKNDKIVVPASDTWRIVTPVKNLTGVTNAVGFSTGSKAEEDGALRIRQRSSTEIGSTNTLEALYAALLNLAGVTQVRIYENATSAPVSGRPANSFEVVIEGGVDADIAATIWAKHPFGIEFHGATTVVHADSQGQNQNVKFTRPTPVDIVVDVTLSIDSSYPSTGDTDMEQAIVDYAAGTLVGFEGQDFGIGDTVRISRVYVPVNSIPGHHVTALQIGNPGLGTADIAIAETEIARFTIANITVTS